MLFLTLIAGGFVILQLFNLTLNLIYRPNLSQQDVSEDLVSVLIPIRNERDNLINLLDSLDAIDDDNFEIIFYDDESSDGSLEIIKQDKNDKIRCIESEKLPDGWSGKNHACYQLSKHAKGKYLLFIDADVLLKSNVIRRTLNYLKKYNLSLVSIFPEQILNSFDEKRSIPMMNYILLTLLPLILVRKLSFKSLAAANGQFMLFDAKVYHQLNPHQEYKNSFVEDIEISKFYKSKKYKIACIATESDVKCRMYHSYNDALNGFSKNIFMFFGNSKILAIIFWVIVSFGFLPVFFYNINYGFIYLFVVTLIQMIIAKLSNKKIWESVLYFPLQLIFILQVMFKSIKERKKGGYQWKGRFSSYL